MFVRDSKPFLGGTVIPSGLCVITVTRPLIITKLPLVASLILLPRTDSNVRNVSTTKISNTHWLILVFLFTIMQPTHLMCTLHDLLLTYITCCGQNSYSASFKGTLQHNILHYSHVVIVDTSHNTILHNF